MKCWRQADLGFSLQKPASSFTRLPVGFSSTKLRTTAPTAFLFVMAFAVAVVDKALAVPPTIGAISNQATYVDQPNMDGFFPIILDVSDVETATSNLVLSLVSSDSALIPTENVVFHFFQPNGKWYLTMVPAFGQTGTATNMVTVSDGSLSNSTSFVLTVNPPPPGAARFANTNAIIIPDVGAATPYPSTINVTGMSGTVTSLTLTLSKINHTYIRDVHMLLVGPTGQGMVVFSRVSSGPVTNVTATLTDASTFHLPDTFELWSEQFWPTTNSVPNNFFSPPAPIGPYGPVTFSNSFNGLPANGAWSLYVFDDGDGDQGSLDGGWSLAIATDARPTILSFTGAGTTNVVITWSAVSNVTYRMQYKSDLNNTNWVDLVPDFTATGNTASATNNPSGATQRFYRVKIVP